MSPATLVPAACALGSALSLAALLLAEWRDHRLGVAVAKPLASAGFVLLALSLGAPGSFYGRFVLAGLVLSFAGDVLLIPRGARAAFVLGLLAFLTAHVAYTVAFLSVGRVGLPFALLAVLPAIWGIGRWLLPHVTGGMRIAVSAYVLVISAMVAAAGSASLSGGDARLFVGAFTFAVSDVFVARERFVTRSPRNALWGLPLYYGAQLLLASTVG